MNLNHNRTNEIDLIIKWTQENDNDLVMAMLLGFLGLRSSEILSLRLS